MAGQGRPLEVGCAERSQIPPLAARPRSVRRARLRLALSSSPMTSAQGELGYSSRTGGGLALAGRGLRGPARVLLGAAIVGRRRRFGRRVLPGRTVRGPRSACSGSRSLLLVLRTEVSFGAPGLFLTGGLALFLGWSALSLLWTTSVTLTMLDVQKLLVYVGIVPAALLVVKRRSAPQLLAGVLAGITLVSAYALATRLLPERLGSFDPLAGYRLTTPVGYWNALGIFSGIGLVLAAGFAARAARPSLRALSAAVLPLLMATFFFTFSRGAWIALVVGLAGRLRARSAPAPAARRARRPCSVAGARRLPRLPLQGADHDDCFARLRLAPGPPTRPVDRSPLARRRSRRARTGAPRAARGGPGSGASSLRRRARARRRRRAGRSSGRIGARRRHSRGRRTTPSSRRRSPAGPTSRTASSTSPRTAGSSSGESRGTT